LKEKGRPEWTPLTRLPGGGESPAFKSFFHCFDAEVPRNEEEAYVAKERRIQMGVLLEKQKKAEEKIFDVSAANSSIKVWRIENLKRVEVDPKFYGRFFSGDSYIVLFKYKNGNRDSYVLYFWQVCFTLYLPCCCRFVVCILAQFPRFRFHAGFLLRFRAAIRAPTRRPPPLC
jgi:hypothetical protein